MSYTWEEVMYSMDTKNEAFRKTEQRKDIQEMQLAEADAAAKWGLGLSLLGGAIFGPVGYFTGKQIARYGTDYAYDWESMTVDPGKFKKQESIDFNESIAKAAKDQTSGQLVNSLIDLGTMYVQAGGLDEGFDPSIGGGDWTTFGTGDNAWTVFGRGTPEMSEVVDVSEYVDGERLIRKGLNINPASENYVPGLFSGDSLGARFTGAGEKLKSAYAVDTSINSISDLGSLLQSYYTSNKEGVKS